MPKIFLGDGLYLDFPHHYTSDRNRKLTPYWEKIHAVARRRPLPLVPLFAASKNETLCGNWDLRIRSQRDKTVPVDASKDFERVGDVDWFTDIHPNPRGVLVAVETEMSILKVLFPKDLPRGGTKTVRSGKNSDDYIRLLQFCSRAVRQRYHG